MNIRYEIVPDGTKYWYQDGRYHRLDGPAIEYADGKKSWYIKDVKHTEEEYYNSILQLTDNKMIITYIINDHGTKYWRQNNQFHRTNGPAIEYSNGTKKWYQNNQLHRTNGPAVEYPDGAKRWYQNGKLHRLDGPAVESSDGTKKWYQNKQLHRTDGPAIEYASGIKEWYCLGVYERSIQS